MMDVVTRLKSQLNAPIFPGEEEKTRQAYLINLIAITGVFLTGPIWAVLPWLSEEGSLSQFLFAVTAVLLSLIFAKFGLLHRGRVREAGFFLVATLWLILAIITLWGNEGLAGIPFIGAIALIPLIAGFVSGVRASVIITVLNWILGGVLVWLEMTTVISTSIMYEPPARYLALMVMFSAFPLLVYLWRRNFSEAIEQVRVVEQAQAETAAYRRQNELLEEAVAARTSALEESLTREQHMAEKLALALESETELGELQSRIITVVSHEFRTPLSVISSSAELLQKFYDRLPVERRQAAHTRIRDSVFYLNDLLKDVTLVDKAQRASIRPSYQTFTFSNLCRALTQQLLGEVSDPDRVHCHFAHGIETPIQTDINLLQQILANLISNGLKYSEEAVAVHFWLDNSHLFIEVKDEGIGVPRHEQARIFELFYRASNVEHREGLGLGLFIVQAICKLLQGSVHLFSEGQETTFEVRLPLLPQVESMEE
ncbi:sensor histidine kinase [Candidatus Leptofilum sp.]|uniref:sensor histidine kinase n=1 Tax=Candidatus Leptofilum sp. TaxID=3241576 RepID=UPI003B5A0393